eukprot:TRINITY_DN105245_c0_g1_i1.p1 TRINITY_DN105245_c0_g1~~TRINITY_DN105245_c0_g1_i1.p1  ORF type:complete len:101 (-),score=0.50 TRINITY_DN105245_c0_g1_i1:711-1013(-)
MPLSCLSFIFNSVNCLIGGNGGFGFVITASPGCGALHRACRFRDANLSSCNRPKPIAWVSVMGEMFVCHGMADLILQSANETTNKGLQKTYSPICEFFKL